MRHRLHYSLIAAAFCLASLVLILPHTRADDAQTTTQAADQPAAQPAAQSTAQTTDQAAEKPAEQTTAKSEEQATDKASDTPVDKTTQMLGGTPDKITLTPEEQRFVDLTNAERRSRKLPELIVAPLLVKVAREKSKEMHDLNYWGHESPVKEKRTAMYRVLYYLPQKPLTMTVGENLYYCNKVLVDEGHKALMESPTHRKNILFPDYRYIGIGTYIADDKRFWTTEVFLDIAY